MVSKTKLMKRKDTRSDLITYGIVLALFAIAEVLKLSGNMSSLLRGLLVPLCYYSILAVSLNLVVGILGDLSLGHAGFMCVGAYVGSVFSVLTTSTITNSMIRFPLALIIGGLFAALFGVIICIPVLRLSGDYLAIVTLAFGEIIKNILGTIYVGLDSNGIHMSFESAAALKLQTNGKILINGPLGISGTPKDANFEISIAILLITVFVVLNFIHSRAGRAVMSLRDNKIAAESIGVSIKKYKLIAFAVSAFFSGVAGVLYSHNLSILAASSKNFGYNMSIMILVFVVLGGIGSIRGSIIAAVVLTALPEMLRGLRDYRMLIYAVVLIAMMIFTQSQKAKDFIGKHSFKFKKDKKRMIKEQSLSTEDK